MRPAGLLKVVRHLTMLQIEPVAAIAPSAELAAWSRLGSAYSPAALRTALDNRSLLELQATIRPREDLALFRADMAAWEPAERASLPGWRSFNRDWARANDACRRDILDRPGASGPLPSRDLPDTCAVPWKSTRWSNNRSVTMLLEFMVSRGEVAIAGRRGAARCQAPVGYFALPILSGDRLVGKLDSRADRRGRVLTVHAIHQDLPFSKGVTAAVGHEIGDLARWLGLEFVLPA